MFFSLFDDPGLFSEIIVEFGFVESEFEQLWQVSNLLEFELHVLVLRNLL